MSNEEIMEDEIEISQGKETEEEIQTTEIKEKRDGITKIEDIIEDIIEDEMKIDDDIIFKSENIHTKDDETSTLNKIVIIIGYICALIIPLIGLIYGIILIYIKKPPAYRNHGTYIILASILMCILIFLFSYSV